MHIIMWRAGFWFWLPTEWIFEFRKLSQMSKFSQTAWANVRTQRVGNDNHIQLQQHCDGISAAHSTSTIPFAKSFIRSLSSSNIIIIQNTFLCRLLICRFTRFMFGTAEKCVYVIIYCTAVVKIVHLYQLERRKMTCVCLYMKDNIKHGRCLTNNSAPNTRKDSAAIFGGCSRRIFVHCLHHAHCLGLIKTDI